MILFYIVRLHFYLLDNKIFIALSIFDKLVFVNQGSVYYVYFQYFLYFLTKFQIAALIDKKETNMILLNITNVNLILKYDIL